MALHRHAISDDNGTGGQTEQALGRSRGGFGTKIHGLINGLGLPVKLVLSHSQDHDVTKAVIADKGYDSRNSFSASATVSSVLRIVKARK